MPNTTKMAVEIEWNLDTPVREGYLSIYYQLKKSRRMDEEENRNVKKIEVVAAVIRHENKIFATQRGYGEFKDGWEFPGGKVEMGEKPQEALLREIREELDTVIEVGDRIARVEYDYPTFHLSMECYWAEVVSGNLILKEHEAARWLSKEELYSVEWLPADLELIELIERVL